MSVLLAVVVIKGIELTQESKAKTKVKKLRFYETGKGVKRVWL